MMNLSNDFFLMDWNLTGVSAACLLFLMAFLEKSREGIMALTQI